MRRLVSFTISLTFFLSFFLSHTHSPQVPEEEVPYLSVALGPVEEEAGESAVVVGLVA